MKGVPFSRNNDILTFDVMAKENLYLLIHKKLKELKSSSIKCEK